jgi:hypothetical protein
MQSQKQKCDRRSRRKNLIWPTVPREGRAAAGVSRDSVVRGKKSRTDLRENSAQLVEVDRFGKVEIEASFLASRDVFLFVKSSKGYAFDWLFSFGLSDYLVAAPVWQANVAQDNIELLQLDNLQRALRAIGQRNLVTEMIEQAGQYSQRVGVIFDDQNSQAPSPRRQSFCWIVAH